jgi:hypothetical protein
MAGASPTATPNCRHIRGELPMRSPTCREQRRGSGSRERRRHVSAAKPAPSWSEDYAKQSRMTGNSEECEQRTRHSRSSGCLAAFQRWRGNRTARLALGTLRNDRGQFSPSQARRSGLVNGPRRQVPQRVLVGDCDDEESTGAAFLARRASPRSSRPSSRPCITNTSVRRTSVPHTPGSE